MPLNRLFFGYGMFQICTTQLWIQCDWVQLYVWYVIYTRLRYSTCIPLYSMAASRSHGTMTPKRNSDTSWAKSTEIYGSAYLAGPYISIHINLLYLQSFDVPKPSGTIWNWKRPRQIFNTIQKGRRPDSERCFKTGLQYVPKHGFQDFHQYAKSFIRRIHDQASGSQYMPSRLSLKNVFKASKALTVQTSWKLEFYMVLRQVFKTVYKRRLHDVESVNYRSSARLHAGLQDTS